MTIAQQLGITQFPFEIRNSKGEMIYREAADGYWLKKEYDTNGNQIGFEESSGYWSKREYDNRGNRISYENSTGYWSKSEYDTNGLLIYRETVVGIQVDKRPKTVELTLDEIAQKLGIDVNLLKIKK